MTNKDVVKKLIGNITPVGETNQDNESFENLKAMCELVEELLREIDDVSYHYAGRYEFSMKRSGQYAKNFLQKYIP